MKPYHEKSNQWDQELRVRIEQRRNNVPTLEEVTKNLEDWDPEVGGTEEEYRRYLVRTSMFDQAILGILESVLKYQNEGYPLHRLYDDIYEQLDYLVPQNEDLSTLHP